jgi:hypothetical protein
MGTRPYTNEITTFGGNGVLANGSFKFKFRRAFISTGM